MNMSNFNEQITMLKSKLDETQNNINNALDFIKQNKDGITKLKLIIGNIDKSVVLSNHNGLNFQVDNLYNVLVGDIEKATKDIVDYKVQFKKYQKAIDTLVDLDFENKETVEETA
jgi:hypothetical protein